jgi:hypothetical protein
MIAAMHGASAHLQIKVDHTSVRKRQLHRNFFADCERLRYAEEHQVLAARLQ